MVIMLYFSNLKDSVRLPSDEKNKRWMSKGWLNYWTSYPSYRLKDTYHCDQKKIPKCLWKLPKKLNHSKNDRFWYLNKNCLRMWGNLGKLIVAKGFKICPKSNKSPNLVTLLPADFSFQSNFDFGRQDSFQARLEWLNFLSSGDGW